MKVVVAVAAFAAAMMMKNHDVCYGGGGDGDDVLVNVKLALVIHSLVLRGVNDAKLNFHDAR